MACQHQYLTETSCCAAVRVKVSTSPTLRVRRDVRWSPVLWPFSSHSVRLALFSSAPKFCFLPSGPDLFCPAVSSLLFFFQPLCSTSVPTVDPLEACLPICKPQSSSPCGETQSLGTFFPVAAQVVFHQGRPTVLFTALCLLSTLQQTFTQPCLNGFQSYLIKPSTF